MACLPGTFTVSSSFNAAFREYDMGHGVEHMMPPVPADSFFNDIVFGVRAALPAVGPSSSPFKIAKQRADTFLAALIDKILEHRLTSDVIVHTRRGL